MESELLLKCIEYFPDYLTALSRTFLRFFFGQPLSKQLNITFDVLTYGLRTIKWYSREEYGIKTNIYAEILQPVLRVV